MTAKSKTFSRGAIALLLALNAFAPLFAEDAKSDDKNWEARFEARRKEVEDKLNLTPEQRDKLHALKDRQRKESLELRHSLRQERETLRQELQKETLDQAKVKAIHGKIKDLQSQMADHRLDGILAVREILTREQFQKFLDLTKNDQNSK